MLMLGNSANSVAQFITLVLLFLFVLGITWFATRYVAGTQKNKMSGGNIKLMETVRINQNAYIQVIRVGTKVVSIVVSKDSVTKLCEHSEDEFVYEESKQPELMDFGKLLQKAMKKNEKE